MRHNITALYRTGIAVALLASAGCASDAAMAPDAPEVPASVAASQQGGSTTMSGFQQGTDTLSGTWKIPVNQPTVQNLGDHRVVFPARAICDPATSGYGPALWDTPCTASKKPVTLTVRAWMDVPTQTLRISFTPDIRFVPSDDPERWVMLYMRDTALTTADGRHTTAPGQLSILWLPTDAADGIDESLTDPSLRTQASPVSGYVWRRIKHFSGYTVAAGRAAVDAGVDVATDAVVSTTTSAY